MKTPTGESDPPHPAPRPGRWGRGRPPPPPRRFPPLPRARGRPTSRRACALSEAARAEETLQAHPPRYSWQPPARLPADAGLTRILRLISVPISMAPRRAAGSALRGASVTWSPPRAATLQPEPLPPPPPPPPSPPLRLRPTERAACPRPCWRPRASASQRACVCAHACARTFPARPGPVLWRPLLAAQRIMACR